MKVIQQAQKRFQVEIGLSEKALALVLHSSGLEVEDLVHYDGMQADRYQVVSMNPNFDLGFGADLNDFLAMGLLVYAKENGLDIDLGDLPFHPYRCQLPVLESMDLQHIDGEIVQDRYVMMTVAIDQQTGKLVDVSRVGERAPESD